MAETPGDVTQLLHKLRRGNAQAADELVPLIYGELKRLASACMRRERPGHTLQATALVHEAYLKLLGQREVEWHDRAHFFAVAATLMRRVLLDHARKRHTAKRGAAPHKATLDESLLISDEHLEDVLAMDECLTRLAAFDPRQARLVELRFFAGLDVEEVAKIMSISTATVKREWASAKAWLNREMTKGKASDAGPLATG
jgi:RNA polymerase sigma factor (TIGR02999 family)